MLLIKNEWKNEHLDFILLVAAFLRIQVLLYTHGYVCTDLKWMVIIYPYIAIWLAKKLSIAGLLEYKSYNMFDLTWNRK